MRDFLTRRRIASPPLGLAHRVYTAGRPVTPGGARRSRLVETPVASNGLSRQEFTGHLASGEWRGNRAAMRSRGSPARSSCGPIGSYSNVVGLPLAETAAVLTAEGYWPTQFWTPGA